MYNLEVEGDHTYFVGGAAGGVWVHNVNVCNPQQEASAIRKIANAISNNAKPGPNGEIAGAAKDLMGQPVPNPNGGYYNHLQELEDAMGGLEKNAEILSHSSSAAAQAARQQALTHLDFIWSELGNELANLGYK